MFGKLRSAIDEWRALGVGKKYFWHGARMVFAEVPVDADAVRDWLPFGVTLAEPARATVFIADYGEMTFAPPYQEAALLLHVRLFGLVPAVYCPWMVLNNDRALILGREMLGLPKKIAAVSFREKGGKFTGSVTRHGVEVIRIEGKAGRAVKKPAPGLGQRTVTVRSMLNVLMPAHALMFHPKETVHRCHALTGVKVTLRSGEDDPVGIATGPATAATIRTCDIGPGLPPMRLFPVSPWFAAHLMKLRVR